MKKMIVFLFPFLLGFAFTGWCEAAAERMTTVKVGKDGAAVSFLEGTAKVILGGKGEGRPLKMGEIVRGGDEISTGAKSRLEITMPDKSFLRFADNSRFRIVKIDVPDDAKGGYMKVHMAIGRAWANVSRIIGGKKNFELTCENAVAGVRGTIYRMNVNEDKSALVRVYDGTVAVAGGGDIAEHSKVIGPPQPIAGPKSIPGPRKVTMEEWTYIIKAMQQIRISGSGAAEKPSDFTEKEDRDAWVDWNKSRDSESR